MHCGTTRSNRTTKEFVQPGMVMAQVWTGGIHCSQHFSYLGI